MRIINTRDIFQPGNMETGQDGIQVNSADRIHFFKEQEQEEPEIILCIEPFSFFEQAADPFLQVGLRGKYKGTG